MLGKITNLIKSQRSCIFLGKLKHPNTTKVVLSFPSSTDSSTRYLLNNLILLNIIIRSYLLLHIHELEIFAPDHTGDVGINTSAAKKRAARFL